MKLTIRIEQYECTVCFLLVSINSISVRVTIDGVWIGFIYNFTTRLVNASNYSVITDLHAFKITTIHAKPSQSQLVVSW
jgi:hypothetical protein